MTWGMLDSRRHAVGLAAQDAGETGGHESVQADYCAERQRKNRICRKATLIELRTTIAQCLVFCERIFESQSSIRWQAITFSDRPE